jgi:RNA polymerase primary sigma factor
MPKRSDQEARDRDQEAQQRTPTENDADIAAADDAPDTEEYSPDGEDVDSDGDGDEDLSDPEVLLGDGSSSSLTGDDAFITAMETPRASRRRPSPFDARKQSSRREDPVKTYLREIGKVPLLTKEQEVELARAMEIGGYADLLLVKRRGKSAALSLDGLAANSSQRRELEDAVQRGDEADELLRHFSLAEEHGIRLPEDISEGDLERLIVQGRTARERLTVSNLRLVVSIAKRYMNRGLSFLDLIQEGNMGLMKAVEKFDYTRGYKFSTYATWWIRQAITRAIADQSRTIRVPVHMIETVRELNRVKREYIQSHGAAPTLEDLSDLTGMSIDKIKKVENVSQYTASLERPIGDDDEDTLGDFIEDPRSPSPTKETFRMFLKEQLNRALEQLDDREREILKLRYGLDDDHPRTLKDVSLKFNITRERVRQIEIKAIEKLKHPSRRAELKRFRELLQGED